MARLETYNIFNLYGRQTTRTCTAWDYANSRGDKALVLHRNGGYDVKSAFFSAVGFKSRNAAVHALIDHSAPGCCDWEEVA